MPIRRQVPLPVSYDDVEIGSGYLADVIVDGQVILELTRLSTCCPCTRLTLLTDLRLSSCRNFNTVSLTDGIRRCVL